MASKIIILSGNGRGIARIYEMTHKIRLEMDAVVAEKNKRLGVMINDTVITYPYVGRQIAIDLNPQKIHKASVIVYSDNNCLLSGASNGKCDIPQLMFLLTSHDANLKCEADSNDSTAEDMTKIITNNAIIEEVFNVEAESSENNQHDLEVDDKGISDNRLFANENIENKYIVDMDKTESINNKPIERDEKEILHIKTAIDERYEIENLENIENGNTLDSNAIDDAFLSAIQTVKNAEKDKENGGDIIDKENGDNKTDKANIDDTKTIVETTANKEHEVVTAMLEGKSEMNNESLPLGTVPFYEKIWHKLEEMFDIYQHDSVLEDLVYDSAWIRIPYEDDGYYVVGVISDDGKPVFICYGIPQDKMTRPDKEIEDSCEWLPIDKSDVSGRGYWLVYQDAMTGENIS